MSHLVTTLSGEEVHLLAERALHWPAEATVFVADLHVGKVATMRALGSPLPGGSTSADLQQLSRVIDRTDARRLVILGDLYHARIGRVAEMTARAFAQWRHRHAETDIVLVPGNHDLFAGLPDADLRIEVLPIDHRLGPFVLRHAPDPGEGEPVDGGYVLAGHLHPGAPMRGSGHERVLLPCFWFRPTMGVLPAFGEATGLHPIQANPEDRVFAIADGEVVEIP
jgi:uncharacterized protein